MIYYRCNDKTFINHILAKYESFSTGKDVSFHCNDQAYDQLHWTLEPELSLDQLMDAYAVALRNDCERLILCWSGGTDSHTIYQVCKRNNIRIDEIIVLYDPYFNSSHPVEHVDWIKRNHYDATTTITAIEKTAPEMQLPRHQNDNWVFEDNRVVFSKFGMGVPDNSIYEHCEKSHGSHTWNLVIGFEKPDVYCHDQRWYSHVNDQLITNAIGNPNTRAFFLEPLIHLKQSHMAKRFLKQLDSQRHDIVQLRSKYGNTGYEVWSRAVGRYPELTRTVSYNQKQENRGQQFTLNIEESKEVIFNEFYRTQNTAAINYAKGWYNLHSEARFYEYLKQHWLLDPNVPGKHRPLWSKSYDLGE